MRSSLRRLHALLTLALALVLLLMAAAPGATMAQDPAPPPVEEPTPPAPTIELTDPAAAPAEGGEPVGELYVPPAEAAPVLAGPAAAEPAAALPAGYAPPAELAGLSAEELGQLNFPNQVQGDIKLDVVVTPARIQAGADLTYTYIFTNTRPTAATNFVIKTRWTNFKLVNSGGIYQYCKQANCPAEQASPGLSIVRDSGSDSETVYRVTSSLAAGQAASFKVVLATRSDQYPLTGQSPKRPAGSASLSESAASPAISEDNANALFVGPVFVLAKTRTSAATKYYARPDQVVEFTINLGNATATGDSSGGVIRADATPATNISLIDKVPVGSQYVSAEGPVQPVLDGATGELRWSIPGPLNPGQQLTIKVRFYKLDVPLECGRISNSTYSVSSDEMPIQTAPARFRVAGSGVQATIEAPVVISNVTATPSSPIFGSESVITIKVDSYWDQPITGLEVRYVIQSNAFFVPGKGTPTPTTAPTGAATGGEVVWQINMPAGNLQTPATQNLTLVVRGDYTTAVAGNTGVASVKVPAGLPSQCLATRSGRANFEPRLYGSKIADPSETLTNGRYLVTRGEIFTYIIEIENRGSDSASNIRVIDQLPIANGANFSYVPGSATLDGQAFAPIAFQNGDGGTITWEGISVAGGQKAQLRFSLVADGYEFIDHCNNFTFEVAGSSETVRETGNNRLCVRISPPLTLTKTASRTVIDGNNPADNKQVTFTLTYTNLDTRSYVIGLHDVAGDFSYVRMDDANPEPTKVGNANTYQWPDRTIGPGESYTLRFVAQLNPPRCENRSFNNDLLFRFTPSLGGSSYIVQTVPMTRATVQYTCGTATLTYSKSVDASVVSIQDRHLFTLSVKNGNTSAPAQNVRLIDVLPPGFTYAGMGASSTVKDQPQISTRQDGRVQLIWTIPSLAANASSNVQFYARSGDIVGNFDNWYRATADGFAGVTNCVNDPNVSCGGYSWIFDEEEFRLYAVRSVRVEPLATVEPSIEQPTACAAPNELRTYQITIVNTNRHAYASTMVTTTLPLGLHFESMVSGPRPKTVQHDENGTVLLWENQYIAPKPSNAAASQLTLQLRLRVGQVWGPLQPRVAADSPDGALPRKDGILDPTVQLCNPTAPSVSLDASKRRVLTGDEYYYVITAVNPGASPLSFGLEDVLDQRLTYLGTAVGPSPTVNGRTLTWSNLSLPAATQAGPGRLTVVFKVKPTGASVGDIIPNRVTLLAGGATLSTTNTSVDVEIVTPNTLVYLPMLRKR